MKTYISLIMGFMISIIYSQQSYPTIYCNEYQNVALIMSEPIAQAITGSEDFIFSYNQASKDSLGLLQGKPGKNSNLLIRTADGGIYNLLIKYSDSLENFVHFIKPETSINVVSHDSIPKVQINRNRIKKVRSFDKISTYYLSKDRNKLASTRKNKIILEVLGIHHYEEQVYMVFKIQNLSKIDFSMGSLDVAKIHGVNNRKSSYQKLILHRNGEKGFPELIRSGSKVRFVLIYPKFTLGDHEKLKFTLSENNGSRFVELTMD